MGPWKSIEEVLQALREVGPDQARSLQEWSQDAPVCLQCPVWAAGLQAEQVVGQDVMPQGSPLLVQKKLTNPETCPGWAVGKTQDREGAQEAEKPSPRAVQCPVKVTLKQMWL